MTFSEIVSRFLIDPRNFLEYALDTESPFGRHKALVFERCLGFSKQNALLLQQQVEELAPMAEAVLQRTDQYGQHYRVDIEVRGMAGQQAFVRTGWTVALGSNTAHLVTCYVLREK